MDKLDEWFGRALNSNSADNQKKPSQGSLQEPQQGSQKTVPQQSVSQQNRSHYKSHYHGQGRKLAQIQGSGQVQKPGQAQRPGQKQGYRQFQNRKNQPGRQHGDSHSAKPRSGAGQSKAVAGQSRAGAAQAVSNRGGHGNRYDHGRGHGRRHGPTGQHRRMPSTLGPKKQPTPFQRGKLKIIPLGGLDEVGKNMMAFEYENDIVLIDMGFEFPSEDMLGIDYVIPDVSYLEENKKRIRGVLITHGHLDHIGGIPYILPRLDFPPVYGTKLTIGLIQKRTEEFKQERLAKLITIEPRTPIRLGQFLATFFRVAHSIPDSCGILLDTPVGKFVHTGDFKFDETPARNIAMADIQMMEEIGRQNVLGLFCESTNALKPGHSMSERDVGNTLEGIIKNAKSRIIIASFASQIGRLQQIIDAAAKHNRKVYVSGRSMQDNIEISSKLGYLHFPKDLIFDIKRYKNKPDEQTLILTTGSQGEAVSALTRIANNEHTHVKIKKGDTIILSSSPIIGNEKAIFTVINNLSILGADVIHNQIMDVHTSGHGKQDELARMVNLIKPQYLIPIHGEYFMRQGLAKVAQERCSVPENRIIMLQNGDVLLAERGLLKKSDEIIETKYILIDGLGEGQLGSQVQMDREIMAENGSLIVLVYVDRKSKKIKKDPDVVSRGFIYMHESEEITKEICHIAADAYRRIRDKNPGASRKDIKKYIRQTIDKFTHSKLERRPLLVPLIVEV